MPKDPGSISVACPSCDSHLEVNETHSGGRSISVVMFGAGTASCADGVERFYVPGTRQIICPACSGPIEPTATHRFVRGNARLRRSA